MIYISVFQDKRLKEIRTYRRINIYRRETTTPYSEEVYRALRSVTSQGTKGLEGRMGEKGCYNYRH